MDQSNYSRSYRTGPEGNAKDSSISENKRRSYYPVSSSTSSSGNFDVMSLLSPSARDRYKRSPSISDGVPKRRPSFNKVTYSVKRADGKMNTSEGTPTKRSVFGRSGIYGALEAALADELKVTADQKENKIDVTNRLGDKYRPTQRDDTTDSSVKLAKDSKVSSSSNPPTNHTPKSVATASVKKTDELPSTATLHHNKPITKPLDKRIAKYNSTFKELDKHIPNNKSTVKELDKLIPKNKSTSKELDKHIPNNKSTVKELDKHIPKNKSTVKELDKRIRKNKSTVKELEPKKISGSDKDFKNNLSEKHLEHFQKKLKVSTNEPAKSKITTMSHPKSTAQKRVLPPTPTEKIPARVRSVSYKQRDRAESVDLTVESDSDDSGVDAAFEGSPVLSKVVNNKQSVTSLDSLLDPGSPNLMFSPDEDLREDQVVQGRLSDPSLHTLNGGSDGKMPKVITKIIVKSPAMIGRKIIPQTTFKTEGLNLDDSYKMEGLTSPEGSQRSLIDDVAEIKEKVLESVYKALPVVVETANIDATAGKKKEKLPVPTVSLIVSSDDLSSISEHSKKSRKHRKGEKTDKEEKFQNEEIYVNSKKVVVLELSVSTPRIESVSKGPKFSIKVDEELQDSPSESIISPDDKGDTNLLAQFSKRAKSKSPILKQKVKKDSSDMVNEKSDAIFAKSKSPEPEKDDVSEIRRRSDAVTKRPKSPRADKSTAKQKEHNKIDFVKTPEPRRRSRSPRADKPKVSKSISESSKSITVGKEPLKIKIAIPSNSSLTVNDIAAPKLTSDVKANVDLKEKRVDVDEFKKRLEKIKNNHMARLYTIEKKSREEIIEPLNDVIDVSSTLSPKESPKLSQKVSEKPKQSEIENSDKKLGKVVISGQRDRAKQDNIIKVSVVDSVVSETKLKVTDELGIAKVKVGLVEASASNIANNNIDAKAKVEVKPSTPNTETETNGRIETISDNIAPIPTSKPTVVKPNVKRFTDQQEDTQSKTLGSWSTNVDKLSEVNAMKSQIEVETKNAKEMKLKKIGEISEEISGYEAESSSSRKDLNLKLSSSPVSITVQGSPVSSSDESDKEWKAKIESSRSIIKNTHSAFKLRPVIEPILEVSGASDIDEGDDFGELPVIRPVTRGHPNISRQYSVPLSSPEKQEVAPLEPVKRKKQKPRPLSLNDENTNEFFNGLSLTTPSLHSPFRDARANLRPRRKTTTNTNPMKLMQERQTESKELEEEQQKKDKTVKEGGGNKHWKKARLAHSAVQGLKLQIDFATAAKGLRKTLKNADGTAVSSKAAQEDAGFINKYPPKMLLQLKGRKHVQCCLVESKVSSLNSGDVFLLVTATELYHFVGIEANVHEKARGNDLVQRILARKELGCQATKQISLNERDMDMGKKDFRGFFDLLGGRPPITEKENIMDDKEFERKFQNEARAYRVEEDSETEETKLVHLPSKRLRYDVLNSKQTFVLDFHTEFYIWCGRGVPLSSRKRAIKCAEQKYKEGFIVSSGTMTKSSQRRPSSIALSAGSVDPGRRVSLSGCNRRGSTLESPHSTPANIFGRRMSITGSAYKRSVSSDNVGSTRRVSVSVAAAGKPLSRSTTPKVSSSSETLTRRRSSIASNRRRSSVMSCSSTNTDCGDESALLKTTRRVSVSARAVRAQITSTGKRLNQDGLVERPDWGIMAMTLEGKEPITLREKFHDWPEPGRIIKMKGHVSSGDNKNQTVAPTTELKPYDAGEMHKAPPSEEILKLEGVRLGRGRGTSVLHGVETTVHTDAVTVWLVHEYENYLVPASYHCLLYSDEGYVVRWEYHIEEYDGFVRKNKSKRCAYYFWQGDQCAVNEKGATALMTVELDKEKGPQIRVTQSREPPSFLNLFIGKLVVRSDKRKFLGKDPNLGRIEWPDETKVFVVRGECKEETHLIQVVNRATSLRSRSSLIILLPSGEVFVWHGSKCPEHTRHNAEYCGNNVINNYIVENAEDAFVSVIKEGSEPRRFWNCLDGEDDYGSLTNNTEDSHVYTPRLYHFTSTTGIFLANEVLSSCRVSDQIIQFPFLQGDMYDHSIQQPALFLLDAKYELWLWQGWFQESDSGEVITGSARQRFAKDKKITMETVKDYVEQLMLAEDPKVYPIKAGEEPIAFTSLFPWWQDKPGVLDIIMKNDRNAKVQARRLSVNTAYRALTRSQYTLEELKKRPEGVDDSRLEDYLSDTEFEGIFKMKREDFNNLASWKRKVLKKTKGLF